MDVNGNDICMCFLWIKSVKFFLLNIVLVYDIKILFWISIYLCVIVY